MLKKITDYIKTNNVSTTEVSDALSKNGSLENVRPIDYQNSHQVVGRILCVFAYNDSNYLVHDKSRTLISKMLLFSFC